MEHRYSVARRQCNIDVLIYRKNNPITFGRIKNFSSQGVLIETEIKGIQRAQHLKLEIISTKVRKKNTNKIHIDALVMHITKDGFGAEIDTSGRAELFSSLLKSVAE